MKKKLSIEDEIHKLEDELAGKQIDELDEENQNLKRWKNLLILKKMVHKLGDTSKFMTVLCPQWSRSTICSLVMNLLWKSEVTRVEIYKKAIRPICIYSFQEEVGHYYETWSSKCRFRSWIFNRYFTSEDFRFEIDLSETELNWLIFDSWSFLQIAKIVIQRLTKN